MVNFCNGNGSYHVCNAFCNFSAIEETRDNEVEQNWQDSKFNFQRSKNLVNMKRDCFEIQTFIGNVTLFFNEFS